MKIASWNVNSINARLPNVIAWLEESQVDVLLMQEIKTVDEKFPALEFEAIGYKVVPHGQKSYNGVAIASKLPFEIAQVRLPGDDSDEQARYMEAVVTGEGGDKVRVATIYLPNGNPVETEKYPYKLGWMDRLHDRAKALLETEEKIVLGGDYNICPNDGDVYDPVGWKDDALCKPESRGKFRALLNLGYTEAYHSLDPRPGMYTFWDYQAGAWQKDNGVRIDHFLLSPQAADCLKGCVIDKGPRGKQKASDHTPIILEI